MTWLKGTTTLGAVSGLLTQLACGEVTDGVGNTCAGGDQWVREVGGQDTMRTPAAKDIASGNWAMRAGYFTLLKVPSANTPDSPGLNANQAGTGSTCLVTTHFTSNPTTSHGRWLVAVEIITANSVAGDYSTAAIRYSYTDLDNDANVAVNSGVAPTSGGAVTLTNGLVVTIADPSGTLRVGTVWARGFTTTYTYGVDYWPMWARRGNGTTTPSWVTAPPGVVTTDYDIIDQVGSISAGYVNPFYLSLAGYDLLDYCSGLGIKTATGCTGARYVGSFPIALAKARIHDGAQTGLYAIDPGPSLLDTVNGSVMRPSGCTPQPSWLQCIKTPGSATPSTAVQYWMSVKNDGIYVVLNADTGATGKLGTAYIGAFTPYDSTNDVLPVMVSTTPIDYTVDATGESAQMLATVPYWRSRRMVNGSEAVASGTGTASSSVTFTDSTATRTTNQDVGLLITAGTSTATVVSNTATTWTVASWSGGTPSPTAAYKVARDWQTGWMRGDWLSGGFGNNNYFLASVVLQPLSVSGVNPISSDATAAIPQTQPKPNYDGNWWLYGFEYEEQFGVTNGLTLNENTMIRGYENGRFLALPGSGWGSGDELTDTNTGTKYFCLMPDYAAAAFRCRYNISSYTGGVAVVEV